MSPSNRGVADVLSRRSNTCVTFWSSSADTDRETTLLRLPRPVIAVALVLCFVVGAYGNSTKSMTASSSATTEATGKPTAGGEAHRNAHVS